MSARWLFVGVGVLATLALYGRRASEMAHHREAIDEARMAIVARGCALAGFDPGSQPYLARLERGRTQCRSRSPREVEDCARGATPQP